MDKGVYCLLFQNPGVCLSIGRIGELEFYKGWHGYIGSALGPGGFARVRRHYALHCNHDRPPTWHVDYLLLEPRFRLTYSLCAPTEDRMECLLAQLLCKGPGNGFGSSDCSCPSHLFYRKQNPLTEVRNAFYTLGLFPAIKRINIH